MRPLDANKPIEIWLNRQLRRHALQNFFEKGLVTLICEIFFAGPRLILVGSEDLALGWAQSRPDRGQLAAMLLGCSNASPKVPLSELSMTFGEDASSLRVIPGVIWLAKEEGVVILSEDLRKELEGEIHKETRPAC